MMKYSCFFLGLLLAVPVYGQQQIPALNWPGKRSDWINVKTDVTPRAAGDGVTDDYAAIQAALTLINSGTAPNRSRTVYFPPGIYRITRTLLLRKIDGGCWLVGHGRNTTIRWDGVKGGTMLLLDGTPRSLFEGIVFDGNHSADTGLDHYSSTLFDTECDHKYLGFKNLTTGVRFGNHKVASAEQSVQHCLFVNCSKGIEVQTFNNYDVLIAASDFYGCNTGISVGKGANTYVRDCHFENSREADISAVRGPEHPCSFIRCTSVHSNRFLDWNGGVSTAFIQNCVVSGWKSRAAMSVQGAPCLIFDCIFTQAPGTDPPVTAGNGTHLVLSNNTVEGEARVVDNTRYVTVVPMGKSDRAVQSSAQSFLAQKVNVPQKVFDVKAFGAVGDGKADDYAAIQAAIDAARHHGRGAIAYLPAGTYKVGKTLVVTGANYTVGGCIPGTGSVGSHIQWGGAPGGVTVQIVNPKNIIVEQLSVSDSRDGSFDIRQTGTEGNCSITYDMVSVYGMYQKSSLKGLQFLNLPKGTLVRANHLNGNIHATNSSRARILMNCNWEGTLTVEGADEKVRDGFLGVQAMLVTSVPCGIYVRDNQNLVVTNFYSEGAERYVSLAGNGVNTNGHVTIAGIKVQTTQQPQLTIDNYKGRVAGVGLQHYQGTDPRITAQSGTQPITLVWMANNGYNPTVIFKTSPAAQSVFIGNTWKGPDDAVPATGMQAASEVLDDFRELGRYDVEMNFGGWQK